MTAPEQPVGNPRHLDLQRLRDRIAGAQDEIRGAFDGPACEFGGGQVWSGSVADEFGAELAGRVRRLGQLSGALLAAIERELHTVPETCSPQAAAVWRRVHPG